MASNRRVKMRSKRRTTRVRDRLNIGDYPRVSIFRSLKHIYAQIIDDVASKTLVSCSSLDLKEVPGDKKTVALAVGKELAKRAKEKNIDQVLFDRGRFLYHGRLDALAQGLRDGGLRV